MLLGVGVWFEFAFFFLVHRRMKLTSMTDLYTNQSNIRVVLRFSFWHGFGIHWGRL